jgi:hypothetical protein
MMGPFIPKAVLPAMTELPDPHPAPETGAAGQDPESVSSNRLLR